MLRQRRRLHFARWLYRTGRLDEWGAAPAAGERCREEPGHRPPAPGDTRSTCSACARPVRPIWYGSPGAYRGAGIYGGPRARPDGPATACRDCRRYFDARGEAYRGPEDPALLR